MVKDNPHLHTVVDRDGAAILDIDRGLISTLNPTGAYVWQEKNGIPNRATTTSGPDTMHLRWDNS